jgi:hypothetical protein
MIDSSTFFWHGPSSGNVSERKVSMKSSFFKFTAVAALMVAIAAGAQLVTVLSMFEGSFTVLYAPVLVCAALALVSLAGNAIFGTSAYAALGATIIGRMAPMSAMTVAFVCMALMAFFIANHALDSTTREQGFTSRLPYAVVMVEAYAIVRTTMMVTTTTTMVYGLIGCSALLALGYLCRERALTSPTKKVTAT